MNIEAKDLDRLSSEIRMFLGKAALRTRLATMAKLYLEFSDVGTMRDAHMSILRALEPVMRMMVRGGEPTTYVDDHTVELQFGGVSIILTCKQRFAVRSRGSIGYRDIAFVDPPKRDV